MFGRLPEMKDENGVNKNAICLSRGSRLYLFEYESGLNMITVAFYQRDLDINRTQPRDVVTRCLDFYPLNRLEVLLGNFSGCCLLKLFMKETVHAFFIKRVLCQLLEGNIQPVNHNIKTRSFPAVFGCCKDKDWLAWVTLTASWLCSIFWLPGCRCWSAKTRSQIETQPFVVLAYRTLKCAQ